MKLLLLLLQPLMLFAATPLSLHPDNNHYFLFRGEPTIIITSAEHYGAVINLDFNYVAYLNELAAKQLNNTRIFSGAYLEPMGAFNIVDNTLAPAAGRFIAPWMRSGMANKFDLAKWNDSYFGRLRDFVRQAGTRGVIVEMVLFCPFYEEAQWKLSPMNASNNINGIGKVARTNVYTLDKHGGLLDVQEKLTRKLVTELNQFDNVYYEICNEPYFGGVTMEWQHRIADVIVDTEARLPNKHLISQNVANGSARVRDPHPAISIFNFHYATPPDAVAVNYDLNKVIGDNETGFKGTNNLAYRREAWEFILAGGGLFNNLDYSFTARHPAGTFATYPKTQPGGGNPAFRDEMRVLRDFIYKFEFLRMKPDTNVVAAGTARALGEGDKAWAIYVWSTARLELALPRGEFEARWVNTKTGRVEKQDRFTHRSGKRKLEAPPFEHDIALDLRRRQSTRTR